MGHTCIVEMLKAVAEELGVSEDDLLQRVLRSVLERQLREVKAEIWEIHGRFGVADVADMEARYLQGTLEEATSWRNLQRLDHLEYPRDRLLGLRQYL
jgi:hypothetical protein